MRSSYEYIISCRYVPFASLLCILVFSPEIFGVSPFDVSDLPSVARINTTWLNLGDYSTGSSSNPILLRDLGPSKPSFLAGFFFCNVGICYGSEVRGSFFAVVIASRDGADPRIIWTANGEFPLPGGARLELTSEGNLEWGNTLGEVFWSSNTKGMSVAGLNLTETGNLVLFDVNKSVVWQSFDHPTDTLVPGQKLRPGIKLTSLRLKYWDMTEHLYYSLLVKQEGVFALITQSNSTEPYFQHLFNYSNERYLELRNGSFGSSTSDIVVDIPKAVSAQYMQLGPDGHLRVYEYQRHISFDGLIWKEVADVLPIGKCNYPMSCGKYGLCKENNSCSAPKSADHLTDIFKFLGSESQEHPERGFYAYNPLDCDASTLHVFVKLEDAVYFSSRSDIKGTNMTHCKEQCLRNCSCRLVVFTKDTGNCLLSSVVFSIKGSNASMGENNVSTFIKVQPHASKEMEESYFTFTNRHSYDSTTLIEEFTVGGLILVIIFGSISIIVKRKQDGKVKQQLQGLQVDDMDLVLGMLCRFSIDELNIATSNFNNKLGHGGFGSVYEGVLRDGTKIAVKRLHEMDKVKRSFLAEVESIGRIHHVNLVRLIGLCTNKFRNYLVYEYMSNGSLDKWIYNRNPHFALDWNDRKNIIQDVAKGLVHLHEECRQKIVHLDVKPQNILLDENLNAKLSDFGLAKLIERNQSKVVTLVRGTPGYLAPEWIRGIVTEKVDVYRFGVVPLEILCGRKHFEESETDECQHLISLVKIRAVEGKLLDMVDKHCEMMQHHVNEVVEMVKLSVWCLQHDHTKRPSMSTVVKVLDGVMKVEENLDFNLLKSLTISPMELEDKCYQRDTTPLLNSTVF